MLTSLEATLGALVAASADPWVILPALVLITFLLEDVAIAAGVALALDGTIGWPAAFLAVAGGIALGDLGLYCTGRLALRVPALRRRLEDARVDRARAALDGRLGIAVLVARVVPGLRLATYTAAGLLGVSFPRFAALVVAAVAAWTAGLFWLATALGQALGELLERTFGIGPTAAVVLALLPLVLLALLLPRLLRRSSAKKPVNTGVSP